MSYTSGDGDEAAVELDGSQRMSLEGEDIDGMDEYFSETSSSDVSSNDDAISDATSSQHYPPQEFWESPYAPRNRSEWPDDVSRKHWIGPYNTFNNTFAKKAYQTNQPEDEDICNIRKRAESLSDMGDFSGARHAWSQIADHYISEFQHTPQWPAYQSYTKVWNRRDALQHIVEASIGGILSTYLAQYPTLCTSIQAGQMSTTRDYDRPDPVFVAVVDLEDDWADSQVLYTIRVLLEYVTDVAYAKDLAWTCSVYRRAFDAMQRVKDQDLSESIRIRIGLAQTITESKMKAFWHKVNSQPYSNRQTLSDAQREAHKIQSMQEWKHEVEELYLQIIADQQACYGNTAEATIDSQLKLVKHYESVGDTKKAKATARQIFSLTKESLGEHHDSTLHCTAALSTVLLNARSIEEAGLASYDCLTNNPGILSGDTEMLSLELDDNFIPQRGWKEMMMVRNRLEKFKAPTHFVWVDYRLYTLCIGTITLAPCYPKDEHMTSRWAPAGLKSELQKSQNRKRKHRKRDEIDGEKQRSCAISNGVSEQQIHASPHELNVGNFGFSASRRDDDYLDLYVPCVPYQHFMTTPAFQSGMPYLEWVKATGDKSIDDRIYREETDDTPVRLGIRWKPRESWHKRSGSHNKNERPVQNAELEQSSRPRSRASQDEWAEVEFDEDPSITRVQGFFNNIHGEAFVSSDLQVDLVSRQWADCQRFTLHQLPDNATKIEIVEKLSVPCYGYIAGTWTDINVREQRKIPKLFVVDASFVAAGRENKMTLFAIRHQTLQASECHEMTSTERRAFCARLNPSLYRYEPAIIGYPCSVYERKMNSGTVLTNTNTDELALWDEMNAREKWDRHFETRIPVNDADRDILAQDLKAEDERRRLWDEEHKRKRESAQESASSLSGSSTAVSSTVLEPQTSSQTDTQGNVGGGGGLAGKFRRIRLRRSKVEASSSQVASNVC